MPTGTLVKQKQTQHQTLNLSSAIRLLRRSWVYLAGGGILSWTVSGGDGTLDWDSDLRIETPLTYLTLRVLSSGGPLAAVGEGEAIYVSMPSLTTDDPAGAETAGTVVDVTLSKGALAYSETLLPIAYHVDDGSNRLLLLDGTILSPDLPTTLGGNPRLGSRYVLGGTGNTNYTLPFNFYYETNQLQVYVNGKLQVPGSSTNPLPEGYLDSADCDYTEVGSPGLVDEIQFTADSTPGTGDVVTFVLSGGGQGPPGPAGFGGLDDAYTTQSDVPLSINTNVIEPVDLKEPAAVSFSGDDYPADIDARVLQVSRSSNHPTNSGQALFVLGSGHIGLPGVFLFRGQEGSTFDSEIAGSSPTPDLGIWALTAGLGTPTPDGKWAMTFLERGVSAPTDYGELMDLLQSGNFQVAVDRGQIAGNRYGELATGQGVDFIRWHVLDVVLATSGPGTTITLDPPLVFDTDVIDAGSVFLGGMASISWFAGSTEVRDFFHANPSAIAGGNPYELRLSVRTPAVGDRELHATYGSALIGSTARVVLFFSHAYSAGEEVS